MFQNEHPSPCKREQWYHNHIIQPLQSIIFHRRTPCIWLPISRKGLMLTPKEFVCFHRRTRCIWLPLAAKKGLVPTLKDFPRVFRLLCFIVSQNAKSEPLDQCNAVPTSTLYSKPRKVIRVRDLKPSTRYLFTLTSSNGRSFSCDCTTQNRPPKTSTAFLFAFLLVFHDIKRNWMFISTYHIKVCFV